MPQQQHVECSLSLIARALSCIKCAFVVQWVLAELRGDMNKLKRRGRPRKKLALVPGDELKIRRLLKDNLPLFLLTRVRLIKRAAVGDLSIQGLAKKFEFSPTHVQSLITRYEKAGGLAAILRNRQAIKRGPLRQLGNYCWLVAGIEAGRAHDTRSARRWLAAKGCIVSRDVARLALLTWQLAITGRIGLRRKIWWFLRSNGYIDYATGVDSSAVRQVHEDVMRHLDEIHKMPPTQPEKLSSPLDPEKLGVTAGPNTGSIGQG